MTNQQLMEYRRQAPKTKRVDLKTVRFPNWQRPEDPHRVEEIQKGFDPYKVRRPLLGPASSSNRFNCVDGQHTTRALILIGFESWECDVTDLNEAGQIARFADQMDNVKKVDNLDKLHAMYIGYSKPTGPLNPSFQRARDIIDGLYESGWDYERGRPRGHADCSHGMIVITSTGIEEVFDRAERMLGVGQGKPQLTRTLTDIAEIWPNDPNATESGIIRAIGKIERNYDGLNGEQKKTLGAVPTATIKLAAKGYGGQSDKRDKLANHIRKDILKLRARGEFRG